MLTERARLEALFEGIGHPSVFKGGSYFRGREIDGHLVLLQIYAQHGDPHALFEIRSELAGVAVIGEPVFDVQWLPDYVVYCRSAKNERVVERYWPKTGRREVLFAQQDAPPQ